MKIGKTRQWGLTGLGLSLFTSLVMVLPAQAAQKILFVYEPFTVSVSIESLEKFTTTGEIDPSLVFYLRFLTPSQQQQLRQFLLSRYDIKPFTLHQLGGTYAGHQLLTFLGQGIQLPGGRSGFSAIRGAIIYSSTTEQGLSILNVLRNFPTDIQIDVPYFLKSLGQIKQLIQATEKFTVDLKQAQLTENKNNAANLDLDLKNSGSLPINEKILTWQDSQRQRQIKVALYIPRSQAKQLPVILISNGLGAYLERFTPLARHLASHGFAVIIIDHPQSNYQRQQDFYNGFYQEPFAATEFIDRPLDITFVLNQLEEVNLREFQQQLNLKEVGIFGYSFGGATAFALAGAKINFKQLEKDCQSPNGFYNISILYQCRALELPPKEYDLKDSRIQAIFAFFPFSRSLYGETELKKVNIPVFWQATDADVITPLLVEHLPPFSWLGSTNKYLVIAEKLSHTRAILKATSTLKGQPISEEKIARSTQNYLQALTLAFFQVYTSHNELYRPYLEPAYLKLLSEEPFNLYLVQKNE